jgi:tetratricopeptide (TPR) repeat protein
MACMVNLLTRWAPVRPASILGAFLMLASAAGPGLAISAPEDCAPAVAEDPLAAREAAARWHRLGGGTPARLCEVAALEALGAHATAAALLTRLAENPNRALPRPLRATMLVDAARLWLDAGQPDLARATLSSAERLAPPDAEALVIAARTAAAQDDWSGARAALDRLLADDPGHAPARALRAAALRRGGDPAAALEEARAALDAVPDLPEARFEAAAALAELGRTDAAIAGFLDLAADHPDHALAEAARATVRNLTALD